MWIALDYMVDEIELAQGSGSSYLTDDCTAAYLYGHYINLRIIVRPSFSKPSISLNYSGYLLIKAPPTSYCGRAKQIWIFVVN